MFEGALCLPLIEVGCHKANETSGFLEQNARTNHRIIRPVHFAAETLGGRIFSGSDAKLDELFTRLPNTKGLNNLLAKHAQITSCRCTAMLETSES
jgi:hypothetical protein